MPRTTDVSPALRKFATNCTLKIHTKVKIVQKERRVNDRQGSSVLPITALADVDEDDDDENKE